MGIGGREANQEREGGGGDGRERGWEVWIEGEEEGIERDGDMEGQERGSMGIERWGRDWDGQMEGLGEGGIG